MIEGARENTRVLFILTRILSNAFDHSLAPLRGATRRGSHY
jgi:hypothetical protein